MDLIKAFSRSGMRKERGKTKQADATFDQYESAQPSDQLAVDMLTGWNCSFPPQFELTAGSLGLFDDARIHWAVEQFGSLKDKLVLEVGPLEAMHTYMLDQHQPKRIEAIEANRLAFMRCLVAQQIMGLSRARFRLGDVVQWLSGSTETFDLIVASGVLYHLAEPGEFIRLASLRSDCLYIWTHFYLEEAMPATHTRLPFSGKVRHQEVAGVPLRYYERSYKDADRNRTFCGGFADRHYWMEREDILSLLKAVGYDTVIIHEEHLDHPGGPCFSLMARRTLPAPVETLPS